MVWAQGNPLTLDPGKAHWLIQNLRILLDLLPSTLAQVTLSRSATKLQIAGRWNPANCGPQGRATAKWRRSLFPLRPVALSVVPGAPGSWLIKASDHHQIDTHTGAVWSVFPLTGLLNKSTFTITDSPRKLFLLLKLLRSSLESSFCH